MSRPEPSVPPPSGRCSVGHARAKLDLLLDGVLGERGGGVLVLDGKAGVGTTALVEHRERHLTCRLKLTPGKLGVKSRTQLANRLS